MAEQIKNGRKADYDIDPVFLERWSPRSFLPKEVPEDDLFSLFEAARWAPSARNRQPWRFILARTKEARETFLSFVGENNRMWCKNAPVLALLISKRIYDLKENRSHALDAGAAWGYLSIQAVKKGLITHPMTGCDFDKARKLLDIPDEYSIDLLIAIGYQGKKEDLPEIFQDREHPKGRVPLSELLFENKFGEK